MSINAFPEEEHKPAMQAVFRALGSKRPIWERQTQFISDNYQMPGGLSFGKGRRRDRNPTASTYNG